MLEVLTVQVGAIEENCYIVYGADEKTDGAEGTSGNVPGSKEELPGKNCVIIDPGDQPGKIKAELEAFNLVPQAILLTHAHFDHVGAVGALRESYRDIPVYAYREEKTVIENPAYSGGGGRRAANAWAADVTYLDDRAQLDFLNETWVLIATPGHTAGSCCYYIESMKLLFAGDTLFAGSCGRTDLPTGSTRAIITSIRDVLMALPDDTIVLPGHMGSTMIGTEKRNNFIMRM